MARRYVDDRPSETGQNPLVPLPSRAIVNAAYDVQDERVFDIVAAHPRVAALLDEIVVRTPQYFPEASGLVIRSQNDPEDGSLSWYVVIRVTDPADVATTQLHRFDHEWWLDAGAMVDPELIVTIEPA
ncbi:MAG: hypothetical protein AVDCRST_MAG33-2725 [uncultured Thermomicrobiales bacterium]|uniref:Uncharacterized protein n=1 Tax=uncultured Thermomicrobiales bacterium TaxID=1645740 RepID=A0A6J4VBM7_9BACT|nr:MAG: hypothetical protein AVDCRST_MAG33-2725 [uncultured Thermomicrobiales bacterium]